MTTTSGRQLNLNLGASARSIPIPRLTTSVLPSSNRVRPAAIERGSFDRVRIGSCRNGMRT